MNNVTWDDIKNIAKEIHISKERWKNSNLVLFGARMNGSFAYERIKTQYKIYAFSDNDSSLGGGKLYEGIPVIEPSKLKEIENILVILTVSGQHYRSIKQQLTDMGIPCFTYMEYVFIDHFKMFEMVYDKFLEDEFSKKVYRNLLMSYLRYDMTYLKEIFVRSQYFELPEFCIQSNREVFVDCGAYTGDTLESYIVVKNNCFRKIYSFEPTEKMFQALCIRRERLLKEWALDEEQIVVEKKIIASKSGVKYFAMNRNEEQKNNRIVNKNEKDVMQIESVSLDEYFADKGIKPTFIKADIEGAEMEMLEGASNIIREEKPLLAISIYHKIEDLYEIPILIKKLNPEYKMAIRQHTPSYWETVLYCYS